MLDEFFKMVVTARDEAIDGMIADLSTSSDARAIIRNKKLSTTDISVIADEFFLSLLNKIQDSELDYGFEVILRFGGRTEVLTEMSDGLAGDYVGPNGYASQYTKYPNPLDK